MSRNDDTSGMWTLIAVVFAVGAIISMLTSRNTSTSTATFNPTPDSFEYRYAKERVKLEGYSDREASQAAEAIVKFHEAQKAQQK
jgi:hypothetical protein